MYVDCTTQKAGGDAGVVRDKRKFNAPRQVVEEKKQKVEEEVESSSLVSNGHLHIHSDSPMSKSVWELPQSLAGEEADTETPHREFGNDITNTQGRHRKLKSLPTVVLQNGGGYSNGHGDMTPGLENTAKALFQGDSPTHCKSSGLGKERPQDLLREASTPTIEVQASRASTVTAEALIHGVAEDTTNCHFVQEGTGKLKTHQGNSRLPSIAKQILYQILGKSPSPELEHVEIDSGQQNMVAPLFQFASGRQFQPSSAAKARAEALLLGEASCDSSSGRLVEDKSEMMKTQWKLGLPTVVEQQSGQSVCPSRVGHPGMNCGQVNSLSLPACNGQQPERTMGSPLQVKHTDDGQEAQPLFQFSPGKHFNTVSAGKAKGETLLWEAPDDCTVVHLVQESTDIPQSQQQVWSQQVPPLAGQRLGKEVCSPQSGHGAMVHNGEDNVAQPLFQFASGKHFKPSAAGKARAEALFRDGANDDCEVLCLQDGNGCLVAEEPNLGNHLLDSADKKHLKTSFIGGGRFFRDVEAVHAEQENHVQPVFAAGKENAVPQYKIGRPKLNFRPPLRTRDNFENIENGHRRPNTGPMEPPISCLPGKESNEDAEANAVQLDDPFLWNDAFLSDDVLLSDPGLLSCLEGAGSKSSLNPWRSRLSLNARKPKTGGSCILNVVMDEEDLAQPLLQWKAVAASKARVDALRRSAPEHKIPYFVKNQ